MLRPDTTNDLIRSLTNEPEKWKVTRGVPVFRAHRREMPPSELNPNPSPIVVTDDDLPRIAEEVNESIRTTGRLPTFTLGHRKFGLVNESEQPPLIGFHMNFRAERVRRPEGSFLALVADEYAAADRAAEYDVYRSHPFRSAEYHPTLGYNGTAALQQPPWLNLGTVYRYQSTDPLTRREALAAEFRAEIQALRQAECESLLAPLEGVYAMDYDRELGLMLAYRSTEEREAHVRYIADHHDPLATRDPHVAPPHYAATMAYMLANPGMKFDDAERAVLARPGGGRTVSYVDSAGTFVSEWEPDPHKDPKLYKEIMAWVRAHPGQSYSTAEQVILQERRMANKSLPI